MFDPNRLLYSPEEGGGGAAQATAPAQPEVPVISADTSIDVPMEDGSVKRVTLQDMAEKWKESQKPALNPQVDEDARVANLWRKAAQGDKAASAELLKQTTGLDVRVPEEPRKEPNLEETVRAMQARLDQAEAIAKQAKNITDGITTLQQRAGLKEVINMNKEHLPFLAKHPTAPDLVVEQITKINSILEQNGMADRLNDKDRQGLLMLAFQNAEKVLKHTVEIYGGQKSTQESGVVDDQSTKGPGVQKARYRVGPNGEIIDNRTGQQMVQTTSRHMVPTSPITDQASSTGMTGLEGGAAPKGPITMDDLKSQLRNRWSQMQGGE